MIQEEGGTVAVGHQGYYYLLIWVVDEGAHLLVTLSI